ncbi:MAG TPA: alpha/beta hydrolase-fold protein [Chitinophagaceae bacterium]|nr:alpha/beta hydrolase-fold protein [Chitinophagaceae bacterium]
MITPNKKWFLAASCLLGLCSAMGQHTVRIRIEPPPPFPSGGTNQALYLAGTLNGWNPSDSLFRFHQEPAGDYALDLVIPDGPVEFKITRGSWASVECSTEGSAIPNRAFTSDRDSSLTIRIAGWADGFQAVSPRNTASPRVRILDTAFHIPELGRNRRVWVYLPPGYDASTRAYPVLYLQDGQNIFDEATSFAGEWKVDEFMDSVASGGGEPWIVVAVDHGGARRLNEYNPYDHERFGPGEGKAYARFLVKTLKKYVDRHFRTRRGRKYTYIGGSSMGGLISLYTVLRYPRIFGAAGIFSPSVWAAPPIQPYLDRRAARLKTRLYLYCGKAEPDNMARDLLGLFTRTGRLARRQVTAVIRDGAAHNEKAWAAEFPRFYYWVTQADKTLP